MSDAAKQAEEAAANENAGKTGEAGTEERTFTQAEVQAMIQGRLAKFSDYETIKTELENIKKESRASKFRGVSRNGVQWQVQLGNTLSKRYIGSAPTEEEAARLYDRKAILTNGLKAKTNYAYTKRQIEYVLDYGKL